jgi:hypothetical protein
VLSDLFTVAGAGFSSKVKAENIIKMVEIIIFIEFKGFVWFEFLSELQTRIRRIEEQKV